MRRSARRPTLLLLLLSFMLTGLIAARTTPFNPSVSCCDHLFYRSMAFNYVRVTRPELNEWPPTLDLTRLYQDPYHGRYLRQENGFNRQPPYSYRIVTPLLARLIAYPLDDNINQAFYLLSFVSLALACFWTALTVFELSGQLISAIMTTLSFSLVFRLTRYHLTNYMLTDPLAIFFIALGVYLMLKRRDGWFFVIALIAVFNKEIHVFLLAAYAVMQIREHRLTRMALASYLIIGASYLAFRAAVPIPNDTYSLSVVYRGLPHPVDVVETALVVFGVLTLFVVSRIWLVPFALQLTPLALGALLTTLFADGAERAYIYAFPIVLLSVFGIRAGDTLLKLLVVAPGIAFLVVELTQDRLISLSSRSWYLIYLVLFLVIEGSFLVVASRGGVALPRWLRRSLQPVSGGS